MSWSDGQSKPNSTGCEHALNILLESGHSIFKIYIDYKCPTERLIQPFDSYFLRKGIPLGFPRL